MDWIWTVSYTHLMNAVVLLHNIDQPFVSALEAGDDDVKFQRIDADLTDAFKEEGDEEKLKKIPRL